MIQGSAASMSKIAAIMIEEELIKLNYADKAWIINLVHDEILVNCKESICQEVKEIMNKCMVDAGNLFCKTVPTKVDISIGYNWGCKE